MLSFVRRKVQESMDSLDGQRACWLRSDALPYFTVFGKKCLTMRHSVIHAIKRLPIYCLTAVVLLPCLGEAGSLHFGEKVFEGAERSELLLVCSAQKRLNPEWCFDTRLQRSKFLCECSAELLGGSRETRNSFAPLGKGVNSQRNGGGAKNANGGGNDWTEWLWALLCPGICWLTGCYRTGGIRHEKANV